MTGKLNWTLNMDDQEDEQILRTEEIRLATEKLDQKELEELQDIFSFFDRCKVLWKQ